MVNAEGSATKKALSVADFCAAWSLSRTTTWRLISARKLKTMKVGRRVLILADSIEEWASRAKTAA